MAFATTNVQVASLASAVKFYAGDWSGALTDAPGTITLAGGRVYLSHFEDQDATGSPVELVPCSVSVSSGTITVTVNNKNNVTQGRFVIIYA